MKNLTELERITNFRTSMQPVHLPSEFVDWLVDNGFFKAPASIHHHGAYSGALYEHSYQVMKALLSFTKRLNLEWERDESPYIVGMFHDLCKIDNYTHKVNECSDSIQGDSWEYNNATLLQGHGEKSVILLQQHLKLTNEEMLCIRWHMGAFDDKENWNSYGRSVTNYPNVLYTHTADMVAARVLGV